MENSTPDKHLTVQDLKVPDTSSSNRLFRIAIICSLIGIACGIFWTLVFGPLTDGPPSIRWSAFVYILGFGTTGFIVGLFKRYSIIIGPLVGTLVLATWAFVFGPKDGWIVIWLVAFGGSGLLWGVVIGGISILVKRKLVI